MIIRIAPTGQKTTLPLISTDITSLRDDNIREKSYLLISNWYTSVPCDQIRSISNSDFRRISAKI